MDCNFIQRDAGLIFETKRVILTEQTDKMVNLVLSSVEKDQNCKKCSKYCHSCKEGPKWDDKLFWENIPKPGEKIMIDHNFAFENDQNTTNFDFNALPIIKLIKKHTESQKNCPEKEQEQKILSKYFKKWKLAVKVKKDRIAELENKIKQREKLNKFLKNLKRRQKTEVTKSSSKNFKVRKSQTPKIEGQFKNRFESQKSIIEAQKAKLMEQDRLINDLKLGILTNDLEAIEKNTKNQIREIFKNCSNSTKLKMPLQFVETADRFFINTQKAPKIIQEIEEKAQIRAQRREVIKERKKLIEEKKKKIYEEALENKKIQDEEDKKRALEAIKERRKKELEIEKKRQENKAKFLLKWDRAVSFYNTKLKLKYFQNFQSYCVKLLQNNVLSTKFYKNKLVRKHLNKWIDFVEQKYALKYAVAEQLYNFKILTRYFNTLKKNYEKSILIRQTADDFYEYRLQIRTFIHWHRHVCVEIMMFEKKLHRAMIHYQSKIIFQYFYLWRSLPAVLQIERAKEQRKLKWRQKVWDILPDYKPPILD